VALRVRSEICCDQEISLEFESNLARELLYLINHTIHHAAYMKLIAEKNGVDIEDTVGLAPSTSTFLRNSPQQKNDRLMIET